MSECVLCDWTYDPLGEAIAVYLPGDPYPVRWYPHGPAPAAGADSIADTIAEVAVVAHWADEHELQLRLALGRRDWKIRPIGWTGDPPPQPVDTVYGVDLASNGKTTIVKATKLWISKAFGVEPKWLDVGPLQGPMTIEYLE